MFASVTSVVLVGVEPRPVRVEVHVGGSSPKFQLVGLPDAAVREAKERVRAAVASSGFRFPGRRVIVNLAPADVRKGGSAYDLPIALGLLAATGEIPVEATGVVALGELALDGAVRVVRGGLGAALVAAGRGVRCLLPPESAAEATGVDEGRVVAVRSLREAVAVLVGEGVGAPVPSLPTPEPVGVDLSLVRGQVMAKRALEIAAAGGHHLLMSGPPGGGKTMMARCLPGILPRLEGAARFEVALSWAAAGLPRPDVSLPPYRSPHHSASLAALIGGGSGVPVPGEATLAHGGVLFLDELGEFPVHLLDALRQPMEDGHVVVARRGASVRFPTEFQLVAATNPCPCGFLGDRLVGCRCSPQAVERYRRRLSGPLLDRFDLLIRVPRVEPGEMLGLVGESSEAVRHRVGAARKRQFARGLSNARLDRADLDGRNWAVEADEVLEGAMRNSALTARGWDRVRRVAATIADLAESDLISTEHVAEALTHRGIR